MKTILNHGTIITHGALTLVFLYFLSYAICCLTYTDLDVDVFAIDSTLYEMSIKCVLFMLNRNQKLSRKQETESAKELIFKWFKNNYLQANRKNPVEITTDDELGKTQ